MRPLLLVLLVAGWLPAQAPDAHPSVISKFEPVYSEEARKAFVNASVGVKIVVGLDGTPEGVRVARPAGFGLDEQAIQAVQTWRFQPGIKDGKPVRVAAMVEVNFRLLSKLHEHDGQQARLNFTLAEGATRPELIKGAMPDNPDRPGNERLRISLTVSAEGRPQNLMILETTNPAWADHAKRTMEGWRFRPARLNGESQSAGGMFELSTGTPQRPLPLPAASPNLPAARIISKTEPEYTDEARRAAVNATVMLRLVVREDGVPEDIRVVRGAGFGLDEQATRTVATWRFEPATKDSKAVKSGPEIEVTFRLDAKNHGDQQARLNFTLPAGASRPELIKGMMPDNPKNSANDLLRIGLTVSIDGKTENFRILESTNSDWAEHAIHQMKGWRFLASKLNGQPQAVSGVLELAVGHPNPR